MADQVKRRLGLGPRREGASGEPTSWEPSSWELARFNTKLARGNWAKIRHYAALLKALTEADARALRLPPQLILLYYPFRLGRLVKKYALGGPS